MALTRTDTRATAAGLQRWLGLVAIMVSTVGFGLVLTVVVIGLPTISLKLGATQSDLEWIVGAFQITIAALMIPAGFLGDRYGRKRFLLGGVVLYGGASLAASQVTSASQLTWLMAAMGAAGATLVPLSFSTLAVLFPDEGERRTAVGMWAAGQFLTLPLGPLIGGWLLNNFHWTWIFWMNLPFALLGLVMMVFFIPESRDPGARRLDVPGTVLAVAGVFTLVYGLIRGPIDGWTNTRVLAGIGAGVVLLAGLLFWERRAPVPLIDLRLFAKPRFAWGTLALCVAFAALLGGLFVLTPYFQVVKGIDVMGTGVRLLPLIGAMMLVAGASDKLTPRLGPKAMIVGGLLVSGAGMLVLSRATVTSGYTVDVVAFVIMGAGFGAVLAPAYDAVLASLSEEQRGIGSALANALGKLSQAIGVVALGSILNSVYRGNLPALPKGLPPATVNAVQGSVAAAVKVASRLPGEPGQVLATGAKTAYVDGMSLVLMVTAAIAVVTAAIVFVLMPSRHMGKAPGTEPTGEQAPRHAPGGTVTG